MSDKAELYENVRKEIVSVITGENNTIARYATAAALLRETFGDRFYWVGFYLVAPEKSNELVVGPYQGTLGCLRIPFGRGVCGTAAKLGETQLVEDVHAFEGHIACDAKSKSEVVVPVRTAAGNLVAVLDVDSTELAAFDTTDQAGLEAICADLLTV